MATVERKQRRALPLRLRLPLPSFVPRFGLGRAAGNNTAGTTKKRTFASASVSIIDKMPSASAAVASAPAKAATKPASDVIAGALARAASQSTIHPLDTLKVRLQARRGAAPQGVSKFGQLVPPVGALAPPVDLRAVRKAVGSLYKGVFGAASGAGIAIGTYFAFYGAAHNVMTKHTNVSPGTAAFVSGAVAAAGSSVVKVPLAVCIRSVQAGVYPNVFKAASSIVGAAGVRGLFTGYAPTLLEDVPDMAFKFAAYESMRQMHRRFFKGRNCNPQEDFMMGAIAGAAAAAATTPLDVVKTNMMCCAASRPTMLSAARGVMAQGGPHAFFTGVGTRALSNGINSAVFFCFFEAIRGSIAQRQLAARELAAGGGAGRPAASIGGIAAGVGAGELSLDELLPGGGHLELSSDEPGSGGRPSLLRYSVTIVEGDLE